MIQSTYADRVIISVLFYNTIHFCLLMLYHSNPTQIENNLIFPHGRILISCSHFPSEEKLWLFWKSDPKP